MNAALKFWKEAATVILAAGHSGVSPAHGRSYDYAVLLLQRSGRSGFMPSACVFPGGLVEPSDFSSEWVDLLQPFAHLPNFGVGTVRQQPATRPPMFAMDRTRLGSPVPGDVAFRICAVRETFEEAGVLLVVPRQEGGRSESLDRAEIARWRSLVTENPYNFVRMCKQLECLPNIWALHEWGNWLTPTGGGMQRRYDTAFYLCCLPEIPPTVQDRKEIVHFRWSTPSEILRSYQKREFWIAMPQFYDLGRMCHFSSLSGLQNFAKQRALEGCERWLPVCLPGNDCHIKLLPGDSLYPENPDLSGTENSTVPEKFLEELQESLNLHRIVYHDHYTPSVYINITLKYKHLRPLSDSAINDQDSKL